MSGAGLTEMFRGYRWFFDPSILEYRAYDFDERGNRRYHRGRVQINSDLRSAVRSIEYDVPTEWSNQRMMIGEDHALYVTPEETGTYNRHVLRKCRASMLMLN